MDDEWLGRLLPTSLNTGNPAEGCGRKTGVFGMFHMSKTKAAMKKVADASKLCKICTLNCFHVTSWQQQLRKCLFQTDTWHNKTSCFGLLFIAHNSRGLGCKVWTACKENCKYSKTSIKTSMDKSIFSQQNCHIMPIIMNFVCSSVLCCCPYYYYLPYFAHLHFARSQIMISRYVLIGMTY